MTLDFIHIIINKYFWLKNGLADILKNIDTNLFFPRCHHIRGEKEYDIFVTDYIITALTSVLEIVVKSIENSNKIFSESGNVRINFINPHIIVNNDKDWLIDTIQNDCFCETMRVQISRPTTIWFYRKRLMEI